MINWESIQQVLRIVIYTAGSFFLGQAVADGEMFQAVIMGVLNIGAFVWWFIFEKNRIAETP